MTPHQAYEIVRAACVKVQPEIDWSNCSRCDERLLHLADVLLALGEFSVYQFKTELGPTVMRFDDEGHDWNLKNDSLEWHLKNQPETVLWLADLLGNK